MCVSLNGEARSSNGASRCAGECLTAAFAGDKGAKVPALMCRLRFWGASRTVWIGRVIHWRGLNLSDWRSNRLAELPPYLFVEIDRKKRAAIEAGRDVIDFGIGDPDRPTPGFIVDAMSEAISTAANHRYATTVGTIAFRRAAADYMRRRFGVTVEPEREVISLLGSKEGIGHLPLAVVNPGETVIVPDPGYPVYTSGAVFAAARCHTMPLAESTDWLPILGDLPGDVRNDAKLMYLNYPNNPTSACATLAFFREAVAFAREHGILIAHDAAYSEIYFDEPPPSILQVDGADEVAIEFHSLSKTFNMTGWRVAFAVGNADVLAALASVKSNFDSGVFQASQRAASAALLRYDDPSVRASVEIYRARRDQLVAGLRRAGWHVDPPGATFYVWAKCPDGHDSMATVTRILESANVVVIPGVGFGQCGDGHVRFALTVNEQRTNEATERIAGIHW